MNSIYYQGLDQLLSTKYDKTGPVLPESKPSSPCLCPAGNMAPLLRRGYHNLRCSPLGRLPEELLLLIICHLEQPDLIRLRHSSRLFLRLYESRELGAWTEELFRANVPWKVPPYHPHSWLKEAHWPTRREMDAYCDDCTRTRQHRFWSLHRQHLTESKLFCSRCRLQHPRHLFSERERCNRRRSSRVCIAHQGAVRLCSHKTVTLLEVRDAVRSQLDQCLHGDGDGDGPEILQTVLLRCDHPSHQPDHQGRARPDYSPARTQPMLDLIIYPRRRQVYVFLKWSGHIPHPGCADGGAGSGPGGRAPVTAEMLRQSLERLRVGAAEFIAPELVRGQLPEMSCLDPNRCVCLDWPGRELMPGGWAAPAPRATSYEHRCCTSGPASRLWDSSNSKNNMNSMNSMNNIHNRNENTAHKAVFQRFDSRNEGLSTASVEFFRCESGHPSCVEIWYNTGIEVFPLSELGRGTGLMEAHMGFPRPSWIAALDPDSYGATDDRIGYGVSWCHNRSCRNYYRCFKKPFMRLKDLYWERRSCLFGFPRRVYEG